MKRSPLVALFGFLVLGMSPSFIDWEESPDKRGQIVVYYIVALLLIYVGLFGNK